MNLKSVGKSNRTIKPDVVAVIKMWHDKRFNKLFKNMFRKKIFDMTNYTTTLRNIALPF